MNNYYFILIPLIITIIINISITYINTGFSIEMGLSIDVNHHVWFTKYIVDTGRIPSDQSYKYMPFSFLIVSLMGLILEDSYVPYLVLIRNITVQIIYITTIFALMTKIFKLHNNTLQLLILLTIAFPISYALEPYYLSVHLAAAFMVQSLLVLKMYNSDKSRACITFLLFIFSMMLSNFSYTIIYIFLLFMSTFLASLLYSSNAHNLIFRISPFIVLATTLMLLFYIFYVVLDLSLFSQSLKQLIENIIKFLKGEVNLIENIKESKIMLPFTSMAIIGLMLYGNIVFTYLTLVLFTIFSYINKRIIMEFHIIVLLSLPISVLMFLVSGYEVFRVLNLVNLFFPIVLTYWLLNFKRKTINQIIIFTIFIGVLILTAIKFIPIFFDSLTPRILLGSESIPVIEYSAKRDPDYIISLNTIIKLLNTNVKIICDKSICHGFMYVGHRDLYLGTKRLSDMITISLDSYDNHYNIRDVKLNFPSRSILVFYYPVKTFTFTEEPIEYRSNLVRWELTYKLNLIYRSGTINVCKYD